MRSSPRAARAMPPVTGASTSPMPRSAAGATSERTASGPTVLITINVLPGRMRATSPSWPRAAEDSWSGVATITITASASAAEAASAAAGSPCSSAATRWRSEKSTPVTSNPAAATERAIGKPMAPMPTKVTFCA